MTLFILTLYLGSVKINLTWVDSKEIEKDKIDIKNILGNFNGIIIPGGFGSSGVEGKIKTIGPVLRASQGLA